jgi:hypothetical protein
LSIIASFIYLGGRVSIWRGQKIVWFFLYYFESGYMFEEGLSVQRLEVKFDSSAAVRHKTLYANGRMQVRVLVLVSGVDSQGNQVSLHGHPALQTLRLIGYNTAAPLAGDWEASRQENRYAHDMAGGVARVTPLIPAADNRLSDPSESVQVFEYWVCASRTGSIQIAAEITLDGTRYRSNGQDGHDSSITLEAISPKQYPIANFMLTRPRTLDRAPLFERLEQLSLVLQAEGRLIHLLDWASDMVAHDAEYASEFFHSGDATKVSAGLRSYVGYIGPVYGSQVTARTANGFRTLAQDPGTISILGYITAELPNKPVRQEPLNLKVYDEYGTEHRVRISPNVANRSFTLS